MLFDELAVPIIQAPMSGGGSTPELVSAVTDAGGLGFLAGGYITADALREQIHGVQAWADRPFGVNLFVPEPEVSADLTAYRQQLEPLAEQYGVRLPEPEWDPDGFAEKVGVLLDERVPVVSFAFGVPPADVLDALRRQGAMVIITVTTAAEARAAAGADALCVQGPDAGGHRSTHRLHDAVGSTPLDALLHEVRTQVDLPLIAAGGLSTGADLARVLAAGAVAAQLGTAYLRSPESGAKQPHKDALVDPRFDTTVVTSAFSGRQARALHNGFIETYGVHAPAAYPQVHRLTAPIRAAAAQRDEPQHMSLYSGTGHRLARAEPAAEITQRLWAETQQSR